MVSDEDRSDVEVGESFFVPMTGSVDTAGSYWIGTRARKPPA